MVTLPTSSAGPPPRRHPGEAVKVMRFTALKRLRVLFINMPLRESATPNTPPQGPGILAARLRQYGAEVSLLDLNAYRIRDETTAGRSHGRWLSNSEATGLIDRHLNKNGSPHIIALSGMITTLRWQQFVATTARRLVPGTFLISGGGLATETKEGLFSWIPELDAVVHSEGDDILLVLAADVLRSKTSGRRHSSDLAKNLGELDGRTRFLYGGDRPKDLDALPFAAWDLLEEDVDGNPVLEWYIGMPVWGMAANNSSAAPFTMSRSLTAVSSRGCPYACGFCYRGAQGERNYGMRSEADLVAEAEWLMGTYGIDFFGFNDDNFAVDPRRIGRLPEAFRSLRERGLRWGTHTRLDEAADQRAEQMAEAGCVYIGFGAESASAGVLERMKKGGFILRPRGAESNQLVRINGFDFPTTMVEGIRRCRAVGIHANCTWIMGYPGESLADLQTSVAFILWQEELATTGLIAGSPEHDLAKSAVNRRMFTATAYPGTSMFKDPACRQILADNFGISFRHDGEPVADEALYRYVLELDDATKLMHGPDGRPLYFGEMPTDQFLEARQHADNGNIEEILDM
ncbi:MAG: radical SAM protein [Patescibacteria group bacterium]|nr:radical SAM protein [Patescibacteria group bacterium]